MPTYFSSSNSMVISVPRQKLPSAGGRPGDHLATGHRGDPLDQVLGDQGGRLVHLRIGEVVQPEDLLERVSPLGPVRDREMIQAQVGHQPPVQAPAQRRALGGRRGPEAADPGERGGGLELEREPLAGLLKDRAGARGWCRWSARRASIRPAAGGRTPGRPGSGRPRSRDRSAGATAGGTRTRRSAIPPRRCRAGRNRTAGIPWTSRRAGRRR